jgi:hypothetical protein
MSYPSIPPGKSYFPVFLLLFLAPGAQAGDFVTNFQAIYSPAGTPNPMENTLYKRDTVRRVHGGIVRHEKNGDIVIATPADAMGRYKIRFYDEKEALLFEIRQIRDPLLIIEKYNFGHAGRFGYELYKDNGLVEKGSFRISP